MASQKGRNKGYRNAAIVFGALGAAGSAVLAYDACKTLPPPAPCATLDTASAIGGGISGIFTGLILYGAYRLITKGTI